MIIGKFRSSIKPFDKFYCTIKAWKQCSRSLQIAVVLHSGDVYVRRLAAFEKLLNEGLKI